MTGNAHAKPASWQSYHLYFGRHYEHMDTALIGPLRTMLRQAEAARWFYIRYTDRKGPHIRLRVRLDDERCDEIDRYILQAATTVLDNLCTLPPSVYEPLIRFPVSAEVSEQALGTPVELNKVTYEPEYDVYGDAGKGMPIAEEFFCDASSLAVDILELNSRERRGPHKTLAPLFAERVIGTFHPEQGREDFLKFYASYWLVGSGLEHVFNEHFSIKLEELRATRTSVLPHPESLPAAEQEFLTRWEKILQRANARYQEETAPYGQAQKQKLVFNFLHLMNNRLGFTPIEEAYVATVLAHIPFRGTCVQ